MKIQNVVWVASTSIWLWSSPPAMAISPAASATIILGTSIGMWAGIIAGYRIITGAGCPYASSSSGFYDVAGYLGPAGALTTRTVTCGQAIVDQQKSLENNPSGVVVVQPQLTGWDYLGDSGVNGCHSFFDAQLSACITAFSTCWEDNGGSYPANLYCVSHSGANPPTWATAKNWSNANTGNGYGWFVRQGF